GKSSFVPDGAFSGGGPLHPGLPAGSGGSGFSKTALDHIPPATDPLRKNPLPIFSSALLGAHGWLRPFGLRSDRLLQLGLRQMGTEPEESHACLLLPYSHALYLGLV